MCVCVRTIVHNVTVVHNTVVNNNDNFSSYPSDSHHCSDDVYWWEGRRKRVTQFTLFRSRMIKADICHYSEKGQTQQPSCTV